MYFLFTGITGRWGGKWEWGGGGGAFNRKFMVPASNIFSDGCIYMCVNYDITSRLDYKFGCKSLTVVYRASK